MPIPLSQLVNNPGWAKFAYATVLQITVSVHKSQQWMIRLSILFIESGRYLRSRMLRAMCATKHDPRQNCSRSQVGVWLIFRSEFGCSVLDVAAEKCACPLESLQKLPVSCERLL